MPGTCRQTFLRCLQSPVQPFCLLWAFLQNSVKNSCLLGVIRCDLEKKSVDHNLKTGQKRTAKGGLPVYLDKGVCISRRLSLGVCSCLLPFMDTRLCFFLMGLFLHNSMHPSQLEIPIVKFFSHPLIGEDGGERVTAYCYVKTPNLRGAVSSVHETFNQSIIFHKHMKLRTSQSSLPLDIISYLLDG